MKRKRKFTLKSLRAPLWMFALAFLIWVLIACRIQPSGAMDKAIDGVQVTLAGLDIAVDKSADLHRTGLNAAVEVCRASLGATSTPEQRTTCLHQFLLAPDDIDEVEEILRTTSLTYDQLVALVPMLVRLRDFIAAWEDAIDQQKGGL